MGYVGAALGFAETALRLAGAALGNALQIAPASPFVGRKALVLLGLCGICIGLCRVALGYAGGCIGLCRRCIGLCRDKAELSNYAFRHARVQTIDITVFYSNYTFRHAGLHWVMQFFEKTVNRIRTLLPLQKAMQKQMQG